jgi:Mrp family chromosome partitioning ATPase
VHATDVPGLLLMPAGATPPDPSSLLTPAALGDVLSRVRSMADAILLDTPPVSAGADATILANAAGGVLLVANHRRGTRSRVLRTVKALRQTGSEIVGLLVNEVSAADNDAYYDYYARAELPELAPPRDEEASLRSAG